MAFYKWIIFFNSRRKHVSLSFLCSWIHTEAALRRCSQEKMLWKHAAILQENKLRFFGTPFLKASLENCFSTYVLCIFARSPFERTSWQKNVEDSEFWIIMKSATSLAQAHLEFLSWGKDTMRNVLITFIKLIYNALYIAECLIVHRKIHVESCWESRENNLRLKEGNRKKFIN